MLPTYLQDGVDERADELELAEDLLVLRRQQRLLRQLRRRRKQLQHRENRRDVLLAAAAEGGGRVAAGAQLRLEAVEAARPGNKGYS